MLFKIKYGQLSHKCKFPLFFVFLLFIALACLASLTCRSLRHGLFSYLQAARHPCEQIHVPKASMLRNYYMSMTAKLSRYYSKKKTLFILLYFIMNYNSVIFKKI